MDHVPAEVAMINLDELTDGFWILQEYDYNQDPCWERFTEHLRNKHGWRRWREHLTVELAEVDAKLILFNVNGLAEEDEWSFESDVQGFVKFESPESYSMFKLRWS